MAVTTTITITGVDVVISGLSRMAAHAGDAMHEEVQACGDRYLRVLRRETPKGRGEQPGGLRAAYRTSERYDSQRAEYVIGNDAPYLRWVLGGRGPIEAKGKALRFVIDGRVIFRKRVGPAAANPFDRRSHLLMQRDLETLGQRIEDRIIRAYEAS